MDSHFGQKNLGKKYVYYANKNDSLCVFNTSIMFLNIIYRLVFN
jgi:hypothetical protein